MIRFTCYVLVTAVGQREHCFAGATYSPQHCTKSPSAIGITGHENKTTYPLPDLLHKNSRLCAGFP